MFTKAIVRKPTHTFANGITEANLGKPDYKLALKQHEAYCDALAKCGLQVIVMESDPEFPDSCFIEDTAVITKDFGVIARPGNKKRLGEEVEVRKVLEPLLPLYSITDPGTLDGGDVMQVGNNFYIGLSNRTNLTGSRQLKEILEKYNYQVFVIPVCKILHFKTGINHIGENNLLIQKGICCLNELSNFNKIVVPDDELYAANCLRVNDYVLVPKGFPKTKSNVEKLGYKIIELELSEFQKMDGGLSCLSLRF